MKWLAFLLVTCTTLDGALAFTAPASGQADKQAAPIFVTKIPPGYRDWKLISVAHEEGTLNSFAAVLGNDVAIKAYREAKLPFPDGAIIAALHWSHVSSAENNQVFGRSQSFVAGPSTNVQFMVKDATKYATTGGWGFAHFNKDTWRRGLAQDMLSLPREGFSRLRLHPIRPFILRISIHHLRHGARHAEGRSGEDAAQSASPL
jgi:hypothetical protein